jgi:hypothetical protein
VIRLFRDKAVVAPDRGTAAVLERRDDIAQIFGVHPGGECGRSDEVAKHHGQLAAFGVRRPDKRDSVPQRAAVPAGCGSTDTTISNPNRAFCGVDAA